MAGLKLMSRCYTKLGFCVAGTSYHRLLFLLGILLIITSAFLPCVEGTATPRPRPYTVSLGTSFASNDFLMTSQNEAFMLDFRQWSLDSGVSQCMAGVRYTYKTPTALIWSFNTQPWNASICSLVLTAAGVFQASLTLANGSTIIPWHTNTSSLGVRNLTLQDDGNLVLIDLRGVVVWQSFGSFNDLLIIPSGMKFFRNNTLYERVAVPQYTDFTTPGKFGLRISGRQDLVLFTADNQFVYYSFGPSNPSSDKAKLDYIIIDQFINFYDNHSSLIGSIQPHNDSITVPNGTNLVGSAMILSNGNFEINYLNFTTTRHIWYYNTSISDICDYPSHCGDYGLCNATTGECSCPLGFKKNDGTDTNCTASDSTYSFQPINVIFREQFVSFPVSSQTKCRDMCNQNVTCNAVLFDANSSTCAQFPILHTIKGASSNSSGQLMFLRIQPQNSSKSVRIYVIIGCTISAVLLLMVLLTILIWRRRRRQHRLNQRSKTEEQFLQGLERLPPRFSYKELQVATKDFSKKLGTGGFGSVYEGVLLIGGTPTKVAVKKLENTSGYGAEQFKAEVATIGNVSHINLVKLKGFCMQGPSRLLVYEFVTRGSLDRWLFTAPLSRSSGASIFASKEKTASMEGKSKSGSKHSSRASSNKLLDPNADDNDPDTDVDKMNESIVLDWETRCKIALHTARALEYLHHQSADHIVHCDIKPQNILLDDKFNAKVADFGLAKLMETDKDSFTLTTLKGTRGYLGPEWLEDTSITTKTDVYSYGVVLLNLITGRRSLDPDHGHLPNWAMREVHRTRSASKDQNDMNASCTAEKDDGDASVLNCQTILLDERLHESKEVGFESNVSVHSFEFEATRLDNKMPNDMSAICTVEKYDDDDEASVLKLQSILLDERLQESREAGVGPYVNVHSFECMLSLALACVEKDPAERPSMASVVQSLESILGVVSPSPSSIRTLSSFSAEHPLLRPSRHHPLYDDTTISIIHSLSSSSSWSQQPQGR